MASDAISAYRKSFAEHGKPLRYFAFLTPSGQRRSVSPPTNALLSVDTLRSYLRHAARNLNAKAAVMFLEVLMAKVEETDVESEIPDSAFQRMVCVIVEVPGSSFYAWSPVSSPGDVMMGPPFTLQSFEFNPLTADVQGLVIHNVLQQNVSH